ncbi:ribonuclease FAU-1 family protein [Nocardia callitridis]|uniref:DUF402 domain-containing protein n=1 Tax=Nocardia callitridis TaxID=648753 RepID=A0ABP9KLP9_9NOCA
MTQAHSVDVHRPKVEYFNIADMTNTDPKGFVRPVERYVLEPWGLYMARQSDHPEFHYLESWLLPQPNIRVTVFHNNPEHERDQDYYIDLGEFGQDTSQQWKSIDHYLDIVVRTGRDAELLDADELLAAYAANLVTLAEAEAAITRAVTAIDGIAANGHSLEGWLDTMGITLTWR